jgi:hypothetical protein
VTAPPVGYAEWAAALDRFAAGDDPVVGEMEAGRFDWGPVAAERLAQRVHDAFFARLRTAQQRLQRDLDHARGSEPLLAQALVNVRAVLAPLARVARLPALTDSLRSHLAAELDGLAAEMQSSLEASARADRAGGERMLALVRANAIRVPWPAASIPAQAAATPPAAPASPAAPPGARRAIILG